MYTRRMPRGIISENSRHIPFPYPLRGMRSSTLLALRIPSPLRFEKKAETKAAAVAATTGAAIARLWTPARVVGRAADALERRPMHRARFKAERRLPSRRRRLRTPPHPRPPQPTFLHPFSPALPPVPLFPRNEASILDPFLLPLPPNLHIFPLLSLSGEANSYALPGPSSSPRVGKLIQIVSFAERKKEKGGNKAG